VFRNEAIGAQEKVLADEFAAGSLGARSPGVLGDGVGRVADPPSGVGRTAAEVCLLAVQPEGLVEATEGLEDTTADQETCAHDERHVVPVPIRHEPMEAEGFEP
jgi:hypothetical protein